jgi:hypothetical protein
LRRKCIAKELFLEWMHQSAILEVSALAHGLAPQRSAAANVPAGRMMTGFLRGLLASAQRVA